MIDCALASKLKKNHVKFFVFVLRMYGVIHRRRGQIVSEEMIEGSSTFTVTAHIPVIESLNLANELR